MQFTDGCSQWSLWSEDLAHVLYEGYAQNSSVELLAFVPGGGHYVEWDDGSSEWLGLPQGLHNQLTGRQKSLPGV